MHISFRRACLICIKKTRRKEGPRPSKEVKKAQENKLQAALKQASENMDVSETIDMGDNSLQRSRSLTRLQAQKEFLKATSLAADTTFETADSITDLHEAFLKSITMYPNYTSSAMIDQLRILLKKKRKKDLSKGLFVFLVQSRVTGAKYWYQWMSFAQQNNWQVLLDAVFGYDLTGFGCLLIKKSVIGSLQKQSSHSSSGIVRISPVFPSFQSDSTCGFPQSSRTEYDEVTAFSGVLTPSLVRDVYETELEHGGSPVFDETEIFSVMKSPVATDDESPEDSMWIDLGQSPIGSPSSVMPLPPPFWFTRKNRNNNVKKVENFEVKTHSPEIQEEYEAESSFRVLGRRVSFGLDDKDDFISDEEYYESDRKEPEVTCRHLDHVNMLGLSKTTFRLRFLINWLVTSLLQLRLPGSNTEDVVPLVHIYGPKIKYERGAAVAFNVRDKTTGLISPDIIQRMAEANGLSLGIAILSHVKIIQSTNHRGGMDLADTTVCKPMDSKDDDVGGFVRAEVVTASLGFLTNFEDVYKLWAFVAKFLNPSFVREYGLSTKPKLPEKFTEKHGNDLLERVTLKIPNNDVWKVDLKKSKGEIWLSNGWSEFVEHYGLKFGHLLVFKYEGSSTFGVVIFEPSASEIVYPKKTIKDDARKSQVTCDKLKSVKSEDETSSSWSEDRNHGIRINDEGECSRKSEIYQRMKEGKIAVEKAKANFKCDKPFFMAYVQKSTLTRGVSERYPTKKEGIVAVEKAKANFKCDKPFFMAYVHKSTLIRGVRQSAPVEFRKELLKGMKRRRFLLQLKNDARQKTWAVVARNKYMGSAEWKMFVEDNGITVGDICVFELMHKDANVLGVTILRSAS
ncbi:pyridoxal phosphate-dependent transferase [Tanacetum coccineum]